MKDTFDELFGVARNLGVVQARLRHTRRQRDFQQGKVYKAEWDTHRALMPETLTLAQGRDYIRRILNTDVWQNLEMAPWMVSMKFHARKHLGATMVMTPSRHTGSLTMDPRCCTPWLLCHEMAHLLTVGEGHNATFCTVYIMLLEEMGLLAHARGFAARLKAAGGLIADYPAWYTQGDTLARAAVSMLLAASKDS